MLISTEGIVLRQVKTSAGRRMILIFTRKYGKLSIGAGTNERNPRSKSALATRPYSYGEYEIFKNRGYYNYSSGEVKKSFYSLGEDLDKYMYASYILELTERVLVEEVPQQELFDVLIQVLTSLESRKSGFETLVLVYEIKLLKILGVAPSLQNCTLCGAEKPTYFSVKDGGMICSECYEKLKAEPTFKPKESLIYSPKFDIVQIIDFFLKRPVKAFDNIALDDKTSKELQSIIRAYLYYHLDVVRLKSESMLV